MAFGSDATNLVAGDTNDKNDIFLRDRLLLPTKTADLSLSQKTSAQSVSKGATLTYTLTIKNNGTNTAASVALTDIPPPASYATLLSVKPTQGSCTKSPISVCRLGNLKPGASATVAVQVKTKAKGQLTNSSSVNAAPTEPTPEDNASTVTTTVK